MTWLIDEMVPPTTADELNTLGHHALSITTAGLAANPDAIVYAAAVEQQRVMVTENVADFVTVVTERVAAEEPCVPLVLVRKHDYPRGRALASRLARRLHQWSTDNPEPYPGPHRL